MNELNNTTELSESTDTAIDYSTCCVSGADFGGLISLYNEDCSNFNAMVALAHNGIQINAVTI